MKENGVNLELIQDAISAGIKYRESASSKRNTKIETLQVQKRQKEEFDEFVSTPIASEEKIALTKAMKPSIGEDGYKYNYSPVISENTQFKTETLQVGAFVQEMLSKVPQKEKQANILYSAEIDGNEEITKVIEIYLTTKQFLTLQEIKGIKKTAKLEKTKTAVIIKREELEIERKVKTRPRSNALTGLDDQMIRDHSKPGDKLW